MNKKYYILFSSCLFLFSCSDEGVNPVYGCIDESASNYCEECNIDDGSCEVCFEDPVGTMNGLDEDCIPLFTYTYDEDIYDIFYQNGCLNCHDTEISDGGLNLSNYANLMGNDVIVPGDHLSSDLYDRITRDNATAGNMPPGASELTQDEIDLIAQWINEGAPE